MFVRCLILRNVETGKGCSEVDFPLPFLLLVLFSAELFAGLWFGEFDAIAAVAVAVFWGWGLGIFGFGMQISGRD